jgi:type IX secretion system PorP/SprF family membrane protein
MRKLIFLICIGVNLNAAAQQKPHFTQYILNNYVLNPAVTGIENYTDIKLSYRNQWTGIEGSPVTTYVSAHGPIGKPNYKTAPTSFDVPGENPRGRSYVEDYTTGSPHHGVGLIVMNDKAGYINRFSAYGTYAFHKPLSAKLTLSAGLMAGITSISLDRSKIVWGNLDPNDPAIGYDNGELKKVRPEIGTGMWFYGPDFYVGSALLNLIPNKQRFVTNDKYGTFNEPTWIGTAGYRFFLSDDVTLLPSAMVQYVLPNFEYHFNAKAQYQDKLWIGASYRPSDQLGGFAAMAGVNISNTFNISYAYDASTTSRLRTYTRNTHEIMLGFLINNRYGDWCPRNVW